jgi:hypothetical protein
LSRQAANVQENLFTEVLHHSLRDECRSPTLTLLVPAFEEQIGMKMRPLPDSIRICNKRQ